MAARMSPDEMSAYLETIFPEVSGQFEILGLTDDGVKVRMKTGKTHLRPGGTVSGPSIFALADVCFYLATLSFIGKEALTVTTNCSINFMNKPTLKDLVGTARVLKLGKTLSVGDVIITSIGDDKPLAHANLTYSIPPKKT